MTWKTDTLHAVVTIVALSSLYSQCPVLVLRADVTVVSLSSLYCKCLVLVLLFCVSIFLDIVSITVTLSCLCLVAV